MSKSINRAIGVTLSALQSARKQGLPHTVLCAAVSDLNAARNASKRGDAQAARIYLEVARQCVAMQVDENETLALPRHKTTRFIERRAQVAAMAFSGATFACALLFSAATFTQALSAPSIYLNTQGGLNLCAEKGNAFRTKGENDYCAGRYSSKFDPRGFDCQFAETGAELKWCGKDAPNFDRL